MIDQSAIPLLVLGAILGTCIGSFLNVVIHRLPIMFKRWKERSAGVQHSHPYNLAVPRSACPKCGHVLRARENVPVIGWICLGGKCSNCHLPISARYPLVELLTGTLFVVTAWTFGFDLKTVLGWIFVCMAVSSAFILHDQRRKP